MGRATVRERLSRLGWLVRVGRRGNARLLGLNQRIYRDPLHFLDVQPEHWFQPAVWPWVPITEAIDALNVGFLRFQMAARLVAFAVVVLLLVAGLRHLRAADSIFAWTGLTFVMCAARLLSLPRYVLVLYPIYIVAAWLTSNRWGAPRGPHGQRHVTLHGRLFWQYSRGHWAF